MLASDYFLRWGEAAHRHPEPLSFGEAMTDLVPHIRPTKRLVKAIARWDQGREQVRFNLEIGFEGTSAVDIRWGGFDETLRGRKTRTVEGVDADGAVVRMTGKRFELTVWHDHQTAKGRALAKRCESWFPLMTHFLPEKPKVHCMLVGWGEAFGPVHHLGFDLASDKVYRFLEAQGYRITWPDMRVAEESELEKYIDLPRGVGYRRSPTETATTATLDWGYRGPKFRL